MNIATGLRIEGASAHVAGPSLRARLLPIVLFEVYLTLTVVVFVLGPWRWQTRDLTKFYLFIVLAHTSLALGYVSCIFKPAKPYAAKWSLDKLTWVSLIATFVAYVPTLLWVTAGNVDVSLLADPGLAYHQYQEDVAIPYLEGTTGPISILRGVLGPLLAMPPALIFFYWERFSRKLRIIGILAVLSTVSLFMFTGRNKGLADLFLMVPTFVGLRMGAGKLKISAARALQIAVIASALLYVFNAFYTKNILQRTDGRDSSDYLPLNHMYADESNFMLRYLPESQRPLVRTMTYNQTHGYYALYLALDMPFESSFPVGHSAALARQERILTGSTELDDRSYPSRLHALGLWHKTINWHTTYVWFASDFSFPGVIVLLFLFGRLAALTWLDSIVSQNPFAVVTFTTISTVVCYMSANNIVFGGSEQYIAFWTNLGLWFWTRTRRAT